MLKSAWIYRFLNFYATGFLLNEQIQMSRLLMQIHTPTHILIYTGGGGTDSVVVFFNGKCFNRNYRLVFDIKCSSCDTFLKKIYQK